jgi:hypothetical protein
MLSLELETFMRHRTSQQRTLSRRSLFKGAAGLGLGITSANFLPSSSLPAVANRGNGRFRGDVQMDSVVHRSGEDFRAGRVHGATVDGNGATACIRGAAGSIFESRKITLPLPPTHIGLHWKSFDAAPDDILVSVRNKTNGQNWSEWQSVSIEAVARLDESVTIPVHGLMPQNDAKTRGLEVFSTLAGVDRPVTLQYRIAFHSKHPVAIDQMALTLIDASPGESSSETVLGMNTTRASEVSEQVQLESEAGTSINLITREEWGADESLGFNNDGSYKWEPRFVPVKKIFIHHTATSNNYSDGAAEVRAIHAYHAGTLGWGDIGYQMLVDRFGNIYEGRRGRDPDEGNREILSNGIEGGHVLSYNYGTSSIAAIGNSQQGQWNRLWQDTAYDALVDAVAFECGRHFLHPEGSSDFLRTDRVWHQTLTHCVGHRDAEGDGGSTQCPGSRLYEFLNNELRQRVAEKLSDATDPPTGLTGNQSGDQVEFDWHGGSNDEFQYFFEGWWRWIDDGISHMKYLSEHSDDFASHDWAVDHPEGASWVGDVHSGNSADFVLAEPGQYTLFVRKANEGFSFADHSTVLVEDLDDVPGDPDKPNKYQVSGGVYVAVESGDEDIEEPIEGATVTLVGDNDVDRQTTTDEDGQFDFGEVLPGNYEITASAEGYETQTDQISVETMDVNVIIQLEPLEEDDTDDEEPAEPVIDEFAISSRTTGPWHRINITWAVSHQDGELDTVVSELLGNDGDVLDSETSNVSGSSATGEHELRTREHSATSVRLTVNASGKSTAETRDI